VPLFKTGGSLQSPPYQGGFRGILSALIRREKASIEELLENQKLSNFKHYLNFQYSSRQSDFYRRMQPQVAASTINYQLSTINYQLSTAISSTK